MICLNVPSEFVFLYYSQTDSRLQYYLFDANVPVAIWPIHVFLFLQDYVDVESPQLLVKDEAEYQEAQCLLAAGNTLEDTNPV